MSTTNRPSPGGRYARAKRRAVLSLPEHLISTDGHRVPASRDRLAIPLSDAEVGFAPVKAKDRVCLSREKRWRKAHAWDKDGKCCWCDRTLAA